MIIEFIDQHLVAKEKGAGGAYLWISFKTIKGQILKLTPEDEAFVPLLESLLNFKQMSDAISRNNEHLQLTEEEVALRNGLTAPSAEACAMNNWLAEELKQAFLEISPTQARRYLLHNLLCYTHQEIARMERCSVNASRKSVWLAKKNLQEILADRLHICPLPTTSK